MKYVAFVAALVLVVIGIVGFSEWQFRSFDAPVEATTSYQVNLVRIDQALSNVEHGRDPGGSVTDFFFPELAEAYRNGATQEEINQRLDKLVLLAEQGKPFSSFVAEYPDDFQEMVDRHRNLGADAK